MPQRTEISRNKVSRKKALQKKMISKKKRSRRKDSLKSAKKAKTTALPLPGVSSSCSEIISAEWTTQSVESPPRISEYWDPPAEMNEAPSPSHSIYYDEDNCDEDNCIPPEEQKPVGLSTFAFRYGGGVVVCAYHPRSIKDEPGPVDPAQNVIALNSRLIAAVSGEKVETCKSLLQVLHLKCQDHERLNGKRITIAEASQLMVQVLFSRSEVGLIAGWDDEKGAGCLYKVDGEKALQSSDMCPVVNGYGADGVLTAMYTLKSIRRYHYNMSLAEAAEVAKRAICSGLYCCDERDDFASVYHVGPEGWKLVNGVIDIKRVLQRFVRPLP